MALSINRSLKLPDDQYFQTTAPKTGICLHHTVGGSAKSSINWWRQTPEIVGTAYVIERDGTIYEAFDPKFWAWQFGLKWNIEEKIAFEKRFIGIEIASEGGLLEENGKLYCFDRVSARTLKKKEEAFDYGQDYRGYRYFDRYERKQIESVIELINDLCARFLIDRNVPFAYRGFHGKTLQNFQGVIGHSNVRIDKSDPAPDVVFWENVMSGCDLKKMVILDDGELYGGGTYQELFEQNVSQLRKMNRAAAAVVKGVLYELQRGDRETFIKLYDAQSHIVSYEMVIGDLELVKRIGGALGLSVSDNILEVHDG